MILAGDIGGTNVRLALFERAGESLIERKRLTRATKSVESLPLLVKELAASAERSIEAAGFGVAGPVREGICMAPNLPWIIRAEELGGALSLEPVAFVNDLFANALGISELKEGDFAILNRGEPDRLGNGALISAGTGLGEALLIRTGFGFSPQPSEGGHASFSPNGEEELELLRFLGRTYAHVSFERVLSGPGLANIYRFEREREEVSGAAVKPDPFDGITGDLAAAVSRAALTHADPVSERALDRFAAIYGSAAGNLALTGMATGGVFLGGGIAPKILPKLHDGSFFRAFCGKGRYGPLLSRIPIRVITNESCALYGAARAAVANEPSG